MYSQEMIQAVWIKATWDLVGFGDPKYWRRDSYGNLIHRDEYGMQSDFGWEIDHKLPVSFGGQDNLNNLRPLHWRANRSRGNWPFGGLLGS